MKPERLKVNIKIKMGCGSSSSEKQTSNQNVGAGENFPYQDILTNNELQNTIEKYGFSNSFTKENIGTIANRFSVSREVIIRRLFLVKSYLILVIRLATLPKN